MTDGNVRRQRALFWPSSFTGTLLNAPSSVTLQLPSDIVVSALFPHPGSSCKHDFIAVLEDCTVLLLDSSAGSISKLHRHVGMISLQSTIDDDTLYIMAKTTNGLLNGKSQPNNDQSLTLLSFPFSSSSREEMWSAPVKPPHKATAMQSFAICGPTLTCVWSDGSVTVSSTSPVQGVRTQHVLEIPIAKLQSHDQLPLSSKKRRSHDARNGSHASKARPATCQVVAPHKTSAIIFAAVNAVEGIRFVLISTLFGAPVSTGHVEAGATPASSKGSLLAAIPPFATGDADGGVVLALGGRLMRAAINVPPPSLAGAVGTLAPIREGQEPAVLSAAYCRQQQHVSHRMQPHSASQVSPGINATNSGPVSGPSTDGKFLMRSPSPWEPTKCFSDQNLMESLRMLALATGPVERDEDLRQLLYSLSRSNMAVTGGLLEKLANRLLKCKQWTLLEQLIRLRLPLALPLCHELLVTCAHAGQYRLLACLMREASDVALRDFVAMLRELTGQAGSLSVDAPLHQQAATAMKSYAHTVASKLCVNAEKKKSNVQRCQTAAAVVAAVEGFSGVQIALHAAVACRLDMVEIRDACRSLDSARAEHLFAYLQRWLEQMLGDGTGAWFHEVMWCVPAANIM